ncbi:hypothetical protein L0F63_006594, partial [Massospora cicadina]
YPPPSHVNPAAAKVKSEPKVKIYGWRDLLERCGYIGQRFKTVTRMGTKRPTFVDLEPWLDVPVKASCDELDARFQKL